ncbi:GNAT family N-acetyltransferase [Alkalihalobacillus pseudalcaliphilus]|uniref:GNAT family N-acetyltransferase n=1 Tax=Alkalihalobacillus pseudalcaliphilus TaxID=79884 RepID=UPI00064DDC45|nr:GNAT family N-acetyltransferase [Alkalihalobacillus pseudalcaliphilus]KMK75792.1 acetyltransferase [Alkalihalobacillus pseudalcaliphilus]
MVLPFQPMVTKFETERLFLRMWEETDAHWYSDLMHERGLPKPAIDFTHNKISTFHQDFLKNGLSLLVIERKLEADCIGYCGLVIGRTTLEEPEIAYELFQHAHGNGYATEAAQAIMKIAKATGRKRLWSTVRAWNTASLRVLEKLDFEVQHRTSDEQGEIVWNTFDF